MCSIRHLSLENVKIITSAPLPSLKHTAIWLTMTNRLQPKNYHKSVMIEFSVSAFALTLVV